MIEMHTPILPCKFPLSEIEQIAEVWRTRMGTRGRHGSANLD